MKLLKFLGYLFLIIIIIIIINSFLEKSNKQENNLPPIKIMNWNLQVFGDSKAGSPELLELYASIIKEYDVVFLQEIRDSDNSAINRLCNLIEGYACYVSNPAGTTSTKEQYGVILRNGINITLWDDYSLSKTYKKSFERPPLKVNFNSDGYLFTVYNIHVDPDKVKKELSNLEKLVEDPNFGNQIILGDLNAGCNYYDSFNEPEFDAWDWIISDDSDTTVHDTYCAYDRIILNKNARRELISGGINKDPRIDPEVSDHYPVFVILNPLDN